MLDATKNTDEGGFDFCDFFINVLLRAPCSLLLLAIFLFIFYSLVRPSRTEHAENENYGLTSIYILYVEYIDIEIQVLGLGLRLAYSYTPKLKPASPWPRCRAWSSPSRRGVAT